MQEYSQNVKNSEVYSRQDLIVVGAGPAGLILAYALLDAGFSVCVVDPEPERSWKHSLCFWSQELEGLSSLESFQYLFKSAIKKEWSSAEVKLSGHTRYTIESTYAKFDSERLQSNLKNAIRDLGGSIVADSINSIENTETGSLVHGKQSYVARMVIVANGSNSGLLSYSDSNPAYQVAYGQRLRLPSDWSNLSERNAKTLDNEPAGFMDFQVPFGLTHQFSVPPSFLYSLPLTSQEVFVEETVLATRDKVDWAMLKNRLELRKKELGIQQAIQLEEEYCTIEMGGGLPAFGRTLAFGAAAGFVHPVTGFQVMRSIRTAPKLAACLKENWDKDLDSLSALSWNAIWNSTQLQNRRLYLVGLDILTRLNLSETQSFFDAFFKGSRSELSGFLLGSGSTKEVETSMWNTFNNANWRTRRLIVQHSMRHPQTVLSSLFRTNRLEAS